MSEQVSPLRLGTRASALARTQSGQVAARLAEVLGRPVVLVEVTTQGDLSRAPLTELARQGSTGVFVSALRTALLSNEIDIAVHSLKDLPTAPEAGITMAAVPQREDPRDALVSRDRLTLGELPHGAKVGTGSPRRASQLRALGLGVEVHDIRGNVDSRLAKVSSGEYDAVLLARAGLARLGLLEHICETLDPLQMLPAPGQGALAVEVRSKDQDLASEVFTALDDAATRSSVAAERAVLAALEAGCSAPVGALAEVVEGDDGEELWMRAVVLSPDGSLSIRRSAVGSVGAPEELGRKLAAEMLADGAADLMNSALSSAGLGLTGGSA